MQGSGQLRIRPFRRGDLEMVHEIERSSFPEPWAEKHFLIQHRRAPNLFLVADYGGGVIGYVVGDAHEEYGADGSRKVLGHVMNIAVEERHKGRGVGTALMDEEERRFRELGASFVYLEVRVSNLSARSFYEGRGYRFSRRLPGYYRYEDGLMMSKGL